VRWPADMQLAQGDGAIERRRRLHPRGDEQESSMALIGCQRRAFLVFVGGKQCAATVHLIPKRNVNVQL
jgi:hypothetical protein